MNDNKAFAVVISVFAAFAFTAIAINAYQEGEVEKMELQLKIEQEKTKQHEGTNAEVGNNQDK